MGKHDSVILIDYDKCSPCSGLICIGVCPVAVLEEGTNGKPEIADETSCTKCEVCVNLCPDKAIVINQESPKKDK
jgi:NAD-dependent dihydropyrimidine dehydrogenase PreA subunit